MSPKQWLALMCFYTAYLFFGASIFYHIEHRNEKDKRNKQLQERIEINELLTKHTSPSDQETQTDVLSKVSSYCGRPVTNHTLDEFVDPYVWSFYHSVFFAFTVCSTLGYGNIAPTDTTGRYFMIAYAIIGIPVNGILYAYLGDYFGKTFTGVYDRYKAYQLSNNQNYVPRRLGMIGQILLYLVPASVVLVFLPSLLFTYFEGWPYSVSVYYSFVTLSTIGFGDFIPTFQPHQERVYGVYFQLYQAFIIIWFVFGLSYLLMLIGFIARGMQSKRVAKLEHQLSENLKWTQQRIWSGVTKDVSYLRRIFNEIYMMKFKPVYTDEDDGFVYNVLARSESCPNLQLYHPKWSCELPRKRAFSENYVQPVDVQAPVPDPFQTHTSNNLDNLRSAIRRSDTDLTRIDKTRTFYEPNLNTFNTADMLARVVKALSTISSFSDQGPNDHVHYSSINQNDAITDESVSSLQLSDCQTPPLKPRPRATSDYRSPVHSFTEDQHEWTWNGTNAQIQEIREARSKISNGSQNDLLRQAVLTSSMNKLNGTSKNNINNNNNENSSPPQHRASMLHLPIPAIITEKKPSITTTIGKSILNKIFKTSHLPHPSSHSRNGSIDYELPLEARRYLDSTTRHRETQAKLTPNQLPQHMLNKNRLSVFAHAAEHEDQEFLEKTTIADLIRALEAAHINDNIPGHGLTAESLANVHPQLLAAPIKKHHAARRVSMFPIDIRVASPRPSHHAPRTDHHNAENVTLRNNQHSHHHDQNQHLHPAHNNHLMPSDIGSRRSSFYLRGAAGGGGGIAPNDAQPILLDVLPRYSRQHNGSRRASMFPENFNEFQQIADRIVSDPVARSAIPPQLLVTNTEHHSTDDFNTDIGHMRRASLFPNTQPHESIADFQARYQRRQSMLPGSAMGGTGGGVGGGSIMPITFLNQSILNERLLKPSQLTKGPSESSPNLNSTRRNSMRIAQPINIPPSIITTSSSEIRGGHLAPPGGAQRRGSLRPTNESINDGSNSETRRSSHQNLSGSMRGTKNVAFRPSQLAPLTFKVNITDDEDENESKE